MLNVMVTGLLCISMLLVSSSCNPCLFFVKCYWNIKKMNLYEIADIFLCYSSSVNVIFVAFVDLVVVRQKEQMI